MKLSILVMVEAATADVGLLILAIFRRKFGLFDFVEELLVLSNGWVWFL